MKKVLAFLLAAAMMGSLAMSATVHAEAEPFPVKNAEASAEQAILVTSFGTSYNDSRDVTIGAVEDAIAAAFPEYQVRRAFTAQIIIDILNERENLAIDNFEQALDRAVADGVKTLVVQPTHLMDGLEYADMIEALKNYEDKFEKLAIARPLLTSDEDFAVVEAAMVDVTKDFDDGETAIVFMGHGTEAESNKIYQQMQDVLTADGKENYFVGTVEATPSLDDVLGAVQAKGTYKKVVLRDMMVVAGDHANNDMAGDEEDSWKTAFTNAGFEVECVLEGLGQVPAIQAQYVAHTQEAIDSLQ